MKGKSLGAFTFDQVTDARVGDKVVYLGLKWEVIDVLPAGTRVLRRPWWKLKRTGVMFV